MKIKKIIAGLLIVCCVFSMITFSTEAENSQTVFKAEKQFSTNQKGVWNYLTREVVTNTYKELSYNADSERWEDGKGGMIGKDWMHATSDASATHETQVVLQFTCPYTGIIDVLDSKGYVSVNSNTVNGVRFWVWKNDTAMKQTVIDSSSDFVYPFEPINTTVKAGDKIRFILSFNGSNEYDVVQASPIIQYVKIDKTVEIDDRQPSGLINKENAAPETAKGGLYSLNKMFSSRQGKEWKYLMREAVTNQYTEMMYNAETKTWTDNKGGLVGADFVHTSADASDKHEMQTCIRFIAPCSGNLTIYSLNGLVLLNEQSTNGIRYAVFQNDKIVKGFTQVDGGKSHVFKPITIDVTEGDAINIVFSGNSDNSYDVIKFSPVIAYNKALPTLASQVSLPKSGNEADGVYNFTKAFGTKQGNVWKYLKREVVTNVYSELSYDKKSNLWSDGKGGMIAKDFVHTSGDASDKHEMQMCIQYVTPSEGNITLFSSDGLVTLSPNSTNGVSIQIMQNNNLISTLQIKAGEKHIFKPVTLNVSKEDKISILFSAKGDNSYDITTFAPVVVYNAYEKIIPDINIEVREDDPAQTVYKCWEGYGAYVNPWYYKYWRQGVITLNDMTLDPTGSFWQSEEQTVCSVGEKNMHPGPNINSVRVFNAPKSGYVTISMLDDLIKMVSPSVLEGDDGVYVSILLYDGNSTQYIMEKEYLFPDGGRELIFENIENLHIYKGWELWFVLDRNINNQNDLVQFAPIITYTEITDEEAFVYLNRDEKIIANTDYFSVDNTNIPWKQTAFTFVGIVSVLVLGGIVSMLSKKRKKREV